jgi:hypothetical protein
MLKHNQAEEKWKKKPAGTLVPEYETRRRTELSTDRGGLIWVRNWAGMFYTGNLEPERCKKRYGKRKLPPV